MKTLLIFILLLLRFYSPIQSQNNPQIDQLFAKVDSLIKFEDFENAENIAYETLLKAEASRYQFGIAKGNLQLGFLKTLNDEGEAAGEYLMKSLFIYENLGDSINVAKACRNLAKLKTEEGYSTSALKYGNRCLKIFEKENDLEEIAFTQIILANIYQNLGNYIDSENFYLKSISAYSNLGDNQNKAIIQFNLGSMIYNRWKENNDDDENLSELNQAENLLIEAKKIFEQDSFPDFISQTQVTLGGIFLAKNDFLQAKVYLDSSLILAESVNNPQLIFDSYCSLSALENNRENYKKALEYCELAEAIVEDNKSLADAVFLEDLNKDILQANLNVEKSKKQLSVAIAAILGMLLIFGWLLLNKIQKTNKLEREKKESDAQRQYDQLLLRIFNQSLGEEREEKRRRYAKILHDKVGSQLAATRWLFEEVIHSHKNDKLEGEALTNVEKVLNGAYNSLRKIIKALEVEANDWLKEIREFCEVVSKSRNIDLNLETRGIIQTLSPGTGNKISGMVFNMVANVLLHANATKIDIQITQIEEEINIIVEDNGDGFNTNQETSGKGLRHIKEDAERLGGTCQIDSVKGRGTTIVIKIPADCT